MPWVAAANAAQSRPRLSPLYAARVPKIRESETIKDVLIVEPDRHGDERGVFIETYRRSWFPLGREMVQGNRADRAKPAPLSACTTTSTRRTTGPCPEAGRE